MTSWLNRRPAFWLALAGLLGLALFLRFYRLTELPPGLFGDEALMILDARQAVETQTFPIYFERGQGYFGSHPLTIYLTLLARWFVGDVPLAIRLPMAAAGVLNTLLLVFTLQAVLRLDFDEDASAGAALLGGFIYAITFPVLAINRVGFETNTTPTFGILMIWFLALGLRANRRRYYLLAGLALGASLYTYYAARFYPLVAVSILLGIPLLASGSPWKQKRQQNVFNLAWVTIAALLAFAPLGLYFAQSPDKFFARAFVTGEEVLGQGAAALPLNLLNSAWRTLASISIDGFGDFIPRHNLPWRAVYDAFLSLLFWVGVISLGRNVKQRSSVVLLSWAGVMLLPVILTMNLNSPHFTRMQGAFPALAGISAVGGLTFFGVIAARSRPSWPTWQGRLAFSLLGLGLLFSLSVSAYDYFGRWANDPRLYEAFQVGDWQAASLALERSKTGVAFLSPELLPNPAHAAFDVLLKGRPASSLRQFPGPGCFVYYDRLARPLTYIVDSLNDKRSFDRAHALFPAGREGATIYHAVGGWPEYQVFEVPGGATAVPQLQPVTANFGDQIRLLGYDLNPDPIRPGEAFTMTFYWQALKSLDADYNVFVHFYAPDNFDLPIAQSDGAPCGGTYTTSRMEAGEIVIDERTLTLPPDFAPATATIGLGLYGWPSLQRLPVTDTESLLPDNRLHLAAVEVEH